MDQQFEQRDREALRDSVRRNAGSAGIAAALLIYFGFFAGLISPTGTSLFDWGNFLFFHTLRIGGIAMAVITVWSMLGKPATLLVDALVSIAIGTLFVLSGAMMLLDNGGTQSFLNVIFGVFFASAGVRNGRIWAGYITKRTASGSDLPHTLKDGRQFHVPQARPASTSLAGQLRERTVRTGSTGEPTAAPEPGSVSPAYAKPKNVLAPEKTTEPMLPTESDEADAIDECIEPAPPTDSPPEPEPLAGDAPGGFLASFADDDSPGRI